MMFSRRITLAVFIATLVIPSIVRADSSFFLPLAAKYLTFDQLQANPEPFVNRPIWVSGYTNGPNSVMNVTAWNNLTQFLTLPRIDFWQHGIHTLFQVYPYFIFLNEATGFPAFGLVHGDIGAGTVIRLEVGITNSRFLPTVFHYHPLTVPLHVQVLAYVRFVSVDSLPFYYLEYTNLQPLPYNITQPGGSA